MKIAGDVKESSHAKHSCCRNSNELHEEVNTE